MRRAVLSAFVLAASASAQAADFTFRVPVNLQDYVQPSSVSGSSQSIACRLYNAGGSELGNGRTVLAIPASGNLNATVAVDVDARPPARPQDATDYKCWFWVADSFPADTLITRGEMKPKAGTTPVVIVSGKIPK